MPEPVPGTVLDRLRANLRAAGVPFAESDLEAIVERGFLWAAVRAESALAGTPYLPPDYLDPGTQTSVGVDRSVDLGEPPPSEPPASAGPADDLRQWSLLAVAERVRTREVSPVELVERCLQRASEQRELNAFARTLDDRARAAARRAEEEIATGRWRGPFHGVPIAIKDLFDVERTPTLAGSRATAMFEASGNATVVERLVAAGAIVIGKTQMAELAYSPSSENPSVGSTRNPWDAARNAGGSSSGSAVAVADGSAFAALGTDTGGSIRIPAAYCGIVGLKPTFGRVSLWGGLPLSWSLDHAGPMTRTVADAWAMLAVIAGVDPRDSRTLRAPTPRWQPEGALDLGVRGIRVGVPTAGGDVVPPVAIDALAAWHEGLSSLEQAGATLVPLAMPELVELAWVGAVIQQVESSTHHLATLRERADALGEFARHRLLVGFAHAGVGFARAQQWRSLLRRRCEAWFESVDLVSVPTMPSAAPLLEIVPPTSRTIPFNTLGWPAVSVPVGLGEDGLPLAIQLVGPPWQEARVLRAARVVEAEAGALSAPRLAK